MTEPTTKRRIDIEKLLQWAYLDELPKLKLSAAEGIWDRMAQYGSLGGINAEQSRFWGSGAQRYAQFGLPHPDAEKIARAVGALKPASIEDDFDVIVGELGALVTVNDFRPRRAIRVPGRTTEAGYYDKDGTPPAFAPRDVILVRTINVGPLVAYHAVMRSRPDWTSAQPRPYRRRRRTAAGRRSSANAAGRTFTPPAPIVCCAGRRRRSRWCSAAPIIAPGARP
jgi:hypothetical protein